MAKLITFEGTRAAFANRYPNQPASGTVDLQAGAAKKKPGDDTVEVQAAAFRGFTTGDKLVCVKATAMFFVAGQEQPCSVGDILEVTEAEARYLKSCNKADLASQAEIAASKAA